jgi:hypothetical protein
LEEEVVITLEGRRLWRRHSSSGTLMTMVRILFHLWLWRQGVKDAVALAMRRRFFVVAAAIIF